MEERARQGLQRLGLNISSKRLVEGLSTANQQLIEIAKALTLDAKLLILDEPTAALGGAETELLFKQVEQLKSEGVGIIYISHRLEEIRKIADRIVVLRDGDKVQEFDNADVPVRTIVEAMVGRSLERMFPEIPSPGEETLLDVRNVSASDGSFSDVSFRVNAGEIFGIAGSGWGRAHRTCPRHYRSRRDRSWPGFPQRTGSNSENASRCHSQRHGSCSGGSKIAGSGTRSQH